MDNTVRAAQQTNDPIPRSLRTFYRDDALMTVGAAFHGGGSVTMDFCFPEYVRARKDMGHVSSMQMTGAILEGGYTVLEDALFSGLFPAGVTEDWYYSTLADWLALRINVLFRKAIRTGEIAKLDFKVLDIGSQRLRHRRLSATIEFSGFCSGETTWVIDPPPGVTL